MISMSLLDAGMVVFCVAVVVVLGSTPTEIELNGRVLPTGPRWWLLRGIIALLGTLMMVLGLVLMPVMFAVAAVHDAVWPWGKRWMKVRER